MSNFKFRDYQKDVIDAAKDYLASTSKAGALIVAPTSHGKSWDIAGIVNYYDGPVLILQPSKELLNQNYNKFKFIGGKASIYSASAGIKEIGDVTYATLGSVKKVAEKFGTMKNLLLIVDEAHFKFSEDSKSEFKKFLKIVKPKKIIGLTATPFKLYNQRSGSTLKMINRVKGRIFSKIIYVQQISDMINKGFWSPSIDELWEYNDDGLILNSTGSDYTDDSIKKNNEDNGVNKNIAKRLLKLKNTRKSILVFVDCLENCKIFVEYFNKKSTAAMVSGRTPKKEREKIIEDFKLGKIQYLFNFGTLIVGFDAPNIDCIVMGRPTNSLAVFYQLYGRGVRIKEGKEDFLFIDCCKNISRLCHPRDIKIYEDSKIGWIVAAGDKVITGVPLGFPIYKSELYEGIDEQEDMEMPYGKYKKRKISQIAKFDSGYLNYMISVIDTSQYGPKLKNTMEYFVKKQILENLIN